MFYLTKEQINAIREEDLESLCSLDSNGLLFGIKETFAEYKTRLLAMFEDISYITTKLNKEKKVTLIDSVEVREEDILTDTHYEDANEKLFEKYGISLNWVLVFFYKAVGLFSGGCTIIFESELSSILISSKLKSKGRWLFYSLKEILVHELCHAARSPIKENKLEEFFAYSLSKSWIRRYFGNCFRSRMDSVLLLLPILLLFFVQLFNIFFNANVNTAYLWILIIIFPLFSLIRNQCERTVFLRAKKNLKILKINPCNIDALLFRCCYKEIKEISKLSKVNFEIAEIEKWISNKTEEELRWKIIKKRFL